MVSVNVLVLLHIMVSVIVLEHLHILVSVLVLVLNALLRSINYPPLHIMVSVLVLVLNALFRSINYPPLHIMVSDSSSPSLLGIILMLVHEVRMPLRSRSASTEFYLLLGVMYSECFRSV